jgi:integrase
MAAGFSLRSILPALVAGVAGARSEAAAGLPRRPEQIIAPLNAARELEAEARWDRKCGQHAFLSTLVFTGVRTSEGLAVRLRDVDLAAGKLRVPDAKTPAGVRYVDLLPVTRDDLAAHKATLPDVSPNAFLFPTRTGRRRGRDNARNRIFQPAVERANLEAGLTSLLEGLTPHSLRRTYCSLLIAIGNDIAYVADQLGHADTSTAEG